MLAAGCGADAPWTLDARPPKVDGMDPAQGTLNQAGESTVLGRYLKPTYNAWSDVVTPVRVFLGDRELTVKDVDGTGTRVTVEVPADLGGGLHDVRVETRHGSDVLQNGYLVGP
jgi:hypothetical protein